MPQGTTNDIITVVIDPKSPLGKHLSLKPDGTIEKKSAVLISRGVACQFYVPDHVTLVAVLRLVSEHHSAAIINAGWPHVAIGEPFVFLSTKMLLALGLDKKAITTEQGLKAFARLKDHATASTWQLLDRDEDKFTPDWATKQTDDEWNKNVDKILPGFFHATKVRVRSSSSRVLYPDGTTVGGGNGHVWIKIANASDAERTRTAITARALENELAWAKLKFSTQTGEECGRGYATIIDASVWTVGRLIFAGCPTVGEGGLRVIPQVIEMIPGAIVALPTENATVNELATMQASIKKGIKLRLTQKQANSGKVNGYQIVVANLTPDTELELEDGSLSTVKALMLNYLCKLRCQAPFRESTSMAAFFAVDKMGDPFVFDSGTDTMHVLAHPIRKKDKDCDQLVREIRRHLSELIGADNAEIVFDEERLRAAWDSSYYVPLGSKVSILNGNHELIDLSVKDAMDFGFQRNFDSFFDFSLVKQIIVGMKLSGSEAVALRKDLEGLQYNAFMEMLKLCKQAKSLAVSVDIFAKHGSMSISDGVATIKLPHRCFEPDMLVEPDIVNQVVADYVQHFPEFMDFLDLVLHARFATDRRQAFVWLHSGSSWGKGFLQGIFANLGLVVEVSTREIERALEGGPVGLSMNAMLRTWILFVDEFKAASSELKLLNTQITLSPKCQLRCTVPLYTKLFASAENVRSLVSDGVESQFNNRFAYLAPSTQGKKLEDRPLFQTVGKMQYFGAVVCFVADFLNKGVEKLRALGDVEASRIADKCLSDYQAAHRLDSTFGNLDEAVDDVVNEIKQCLIDYAYWIYPSNPDSIPPLSVQGIGSQLLTTLKRTAVVGYVSTGEHSKDRRFAIVLGDAEKFIKSYAALSGDPSTVRKMQYKCDVIAEKLDMRTDTSDGRFRVYSAEKTGTQIAHKRGIVVFG
jgi:hypothetical protein